MEKVLQEVGTEHPLKHVETVDKSVPHIEGDVKLKKVDREGFLKAVEEGADLKHVDSTNDRSAPAVPGDVHIKKVDRGQFLGEVQKGVDLKHAS